MDEKIIVKSEQYNIKRVLFFVWGIGLMMAILSFCIELEMDRGSSYYERFAPYRRSFWSYLVGSYNRGWIRIYNFPVTAIVFFSFILIGLLIFWRLSKNEITVTNKRVYGKKTFGKRVDLPFDSVSAIGLKWPKGLVIATSSGRNAFLMLKNRNEIYNSVSELLLKRQTKFIETIEIKQEIPQSNVDELKKFKELFDSGIITQEEFNAKKKQLLGL